MNLDRFKYQIPTQLIATEPASPRDSARLFVYHANSGLIEHRTVTDLPRLISESLIVVNDTTVVPARVKGNHKGEEIELLFLVNEEWGENNTIRALVNRRVRVGDEITVEGVVFVVIEDHEKSMLLTFTVNRSQILALLDSKGSVPLPPYIKSEHSEAEKRSEYQTIFATNAPSIAAPTASLHFTTDLLQKLAANGVERAEITLQVGLGTFAPIFPENFVNKNLHKEVFAVPKTTATKIAVAKQDKRPVVAIGTTVCRTLESAKDSILNGQPEFGTTDIFVFPPYHFTIPDILMTNFHVPQSSLMCLVQAFLEDKGAKHTLVELYEVAIKERYRFYSFGDAMLILP